MSRLYDAKPNRDPTTTSEVPKPPGVCECGDTTMHHRVTVVDDAGKMRTGVFSVFGYSKRQGDYKTTLHLRNPHTFMSWKSYCDKCNIKYYGDGTMENLIQHKMQTLGLVGVGKAGCMEALKKHSKILKGKGYEANVNTKTES
jgi:hypothetical protein